MTDSIILDKKNISGKKRKKIVIILSAILALLIISFNTVYFSWNYWTIRGLLLNDNVIDTLNNYKYGEYNGYGYNYIEKYYPGTDRFRFFIYDGIDYFTITYYETDAYFSVYTDLDYCYLIDSSCLSKEVLKSYIDNKSEKILSEIKKGISGPEYMFKIKLTAYYGGDAYSNLDSPDIKEYRATSNMKNFFVRIDHYSNKFYYDFNNKGSRYIASTGGTQAKPKKVVGTISSVEEFNAMLEEADFELTYYDLFGEIETIN